MSEIFYLIFMFTGIIAGTLQIQKIESLPGLKTFIFARDPNFFAEIAQGASVSINGVCLTVAKLKPDSVSFDVMSQTLFVTNLDNLQVGELVNIERSAKAGAEIGGHTLSGHIDGVLKIIDITKPKNNFIISFEIPDKFSPYIFNKGYVALNGASLTVAELDKAKKRFSVYLIPETLRLTNFSLRKAGDLVNFEVDRQTQVIVDTVSRLFSEMQK